MISGETILNILRGMNNMAVINSGSQLIKTLFHMYIYEWQLQTPVRRIADAARHDDQSSYSTVKETGPAQRQCTKVKGSISCSGV